jgi:hypothetical protein
MFIGLLLALLSGFCYGICFLPMRYMNKFAWENTWFVYSLFGVLILPVLRGWLAMPFLFDLYRQVGWRTNSIMLALGFISGAAAVLYGLALIRIGMALVNAIGNGISIVLGSSIPLLIQHREALQGRLGFALVSGVILGSLSCLTASPLPSCPSRRSSTPGSTARAPMERSSTPRDEICSPIQMILDHVPFKHGIIQPVGDTTGPGGLARELRHIPVHVQIARDMEDLCPRATLYNFTNPLTVMTQAITRFSNIRCMGLCIGPDITWNHLCRVCGVEKDQTSAIIAGINHCHWVVDFRIKGEDAFPMLRAILDQDTERSEWKFGSQIARPQETVKQPLCIRLFRHFGAYPGPGDGHVGEFFPQLMRPLIENVETFQSEAIKYVYQSYPVLWQKMEDIGKKGAPIDTEAFAKESAWDHTQFLDILVSQQDNLGRVQYVNIPKRDYIHNLPEDTRSTNALPAFACARAFRAPV